MALGGESVVAIECHLAPDCAFHARLLKQPVLRVKYASMRRYCFGTGMSSCARLDAYTSGRRPADYLLPTGDIDIKLADAPPRIVVVDDVPVFRKLAEGIVQAAVDGAELVPADNARDALHLIAAGPVDLIVTDYNMPQMDGGALVRELRSRPATAQVPVIVLTTETDDAKRQECLSFERVRWVEKSPQHDPLFAAVRELLYEGRA